MEVVNGYVCNNCSDVANAKRGVDPARTKDGPNGAYAADKAEESKATERAPAVTFGGELSGANGVEAVRPAAYVPGSTVSLKA
jgi:hypothetical protein